MPAAAHSARTQGLTVGELQPGSPGHSLPAAATPQRTCSGSVRSDCPDQAPFAATMPRLRRTGYRGTASVPQRCPQHDGIQGLFAEEVRRSRQLIVEQGVQQVVHDLGKVTTEDVRAAVAAENEPVLSEAEPEQVQEQPTEAAKSAPLPSIVFLDEAGLEAFVDRHRPKGDDKFKRAQAMAERIKRAGHGSRQLGLLPPGLESPAG